MPKISALTAASAPDADDLLYIVEDGNSRKATVEQVGKAATNATGNAPIYACRAWVNFNGTGTVSVRASGNVSSVTDLGVGNYRINIATILPDASYAAVVNASSNYSAMLSQVSFDNRFAGSCQIFPVTNLAGSVVDASHVDVAIFR